MVATEMLIPLRVNVRVLDRGAAVLAYARDNEEAWGFPPDYDWTVEEAVYESIVLNRCVPLDLQLELVS